MVDTLAFKKCFAHISIAKEALADRDSQTKATMKSIEDYREYESLFGQTVFHNQIEDFLRGKSNDEKVRFIEDLRNTFLPYKNALGNFKSTEELFIPNIYLKECKDRIDSFFAFLNKITPINTSEEEQLTLIYKPEAFDGHYRYTEKESFLEKLDGIKEYKLYEQRHTLAAIAYIFYKGRLITNCNTYKNVLRFFCECYGQPMSTYKPNDVKKEAEELKRKYGFLDI